MGTTKTVNIYVDESMLSVAQYEMFFFKGQRGINEDDANAVLKADRMNLPCRKLYGFASEQIKKQILVDGKASGMIQNEGVCLHWKLDGDLSDVSKDEKEKIVSSALDGDWDQDAAPLSYHEFLTA